MLKAEAAIWAICFFGMVAVWHDQPAPRPPTLLSSREMFSAHVGHRVRIRGTPQSGKPWASVETSFYSMPIPEMSRWPRDAGPIVEVEGILAWREPRYIEPTKEPVQGYAGGQVVNGYYYMRNVSWMKVPNH